MNYEVLYSYYNFSDLIDDIDRANKIFQICILHNRYSSPRSFHCSIQNNWLDSPDVSRKHLDLIIKMITNEITLHLFTGYQCRAVFLPTCHYKFIRTKQLYLLGLVVGWLLQWYIAHFYISIFSLTQIDKQQRWPPWHYSISPIFTRLWDRRTSTF